MSGSSNAQIAIKVTASSAAATKEIAALNKRIADLSKTNEVMGAGLLRLSKNSVGLDTLGKGMRGFAQESSSAFENIGRLIPQLGLITGAASVAGLAALTEHWANMGTQMLNMSHRTGVAVGALGVMESSARMAGVSSEAMASGVKTLSDNLTNLKLGRAAPETAAAFGILQIATQNADGSIRSAADAMPDIADKIAGMKNPTVQATYATMLLGSAGEALLPYLRLGRAGIEEYNKKAREYGVFSKEGAEAADELRRKQTDLTLAVEGLGYTIAEQLAPVLGPLLQSFASWIAQNRGLIGQDIAGWVTTISDDAKILKNHLDPVVDKFGGWNKVLTDLAPLIVLRLVPGVAALENALIRLAAVRIPTALLTVLGAPASVLAALAALGSYASYKGAKTSMDMAGIAANLGYTDVAQVDDAGNPVSVTNPKTGMTKSIQDFDISTHPNLVNPSAGPGATLGDRYNNPLDLKGAGTIGVDEKGFGIYKTRAEGVAAAENQLLRYQDEGLKTLGAMINKWAPASDGNDPTGYSHQVADAVSKSLHRTVGVDSQIDMRDPAVARAVVTAMAKRESGVTLSPEDANINPPANINGGTGASTPAPASPTVNGSVTVGVSFKNAPPGTTTTAAATGPIFGGPPKVEQSMPNNGLGGLY